MVTTSRDPAPSTPTATPSSQPDPPVWWLDLGIVSFALVVLLVGAVGLVLAMAGWFTWWLALALGGAAAAPVLWRLRAEFPRAPAARDRNIGAVLAVLIALIAAGWGMFAPSHHVFIDRDPGSYVATAKWLNSAGSVEAIDVAGPFEPEGLASLSSAAVTEVERGVLQFQFNHFVAAYLAVADGVLGNFGLFRAVALLGAASLIAIYSVTARVTGRPLLSLVAPALLGLSLPFLSVTRDVYSEPAALLFLWTAVLVLDQAFRRPRVLTAAVGGLLLGATVMVRVDSAVYLAVLATSLGAFVLADRARGGDARRQLLLIAACVGAAVPPVVAGVVDVMVFSEAYYSSVRDMLVPLWLLTFVLALAAVAARNLEPDGRLLRTVSTYRSQLAAIASVSVAAAMLAGWFVRPYVMEARRPVQTWGLLAGVQQEEGDPVDLYLSYAEDTVRWMGWYLGAIGLGLAILGLAVMVHRLIKGRGTPAEFVVSLLLIAVGGIYFWNPRITSDHIWAMRRFVPAVLPALAVAAVVALAWGLERVGPKRWHRWGVVGVGVLALAGVASTSLRVPLFRSQHGYAAVVEEACDLIGPDRAVLVVGRPSVDVLPQTLRSWCDVHVASALEGLGEDPVALSEMASRISASGSELVVVSLGTEALAAAASIPGAEVLTTSTALATNRLEHTLTEMPDEYLQNHETFNLPAEMQLNIVELPSGGAG